MKHPLVPSIVALAAATLSDTRAGDGVLDLTRLANYAAQPVPAYITKDNTPGNPITDEGATLGRVLFLDRRLSRNDTVHRAIRTSRRSPPSSRRAPSTACSSP